MTSDIQPVVEQQNQFTLSEKHSQLTDEQKAKINQTMKFIEGACAQWDMVKLKGHKVENFIQIFAGTLMEYDTMLTKHQMEPDRAKFLLMVKIRESLVDIAIEDNKKQ